MKLPFKKLNNFNKKQDKDLRHRDSDGDGLSDHDEIYNYGTNPFDPDTDQDGVNDGEEIRRGTNPLGNGLLKDLFIPYRGNDYKPDILLPKRLLFYSITAVAMKLIIVSVILVFPIAAWLTPDILSKESAKVIVLTNRIRQNLSVPTLRESKALDQAAYGKAQDMLLQQYFAHVGPDGRDLSDWILASGYQYDVAGENLAMGFASSEEVVDAWTKSRTHYANLIDPDFKDIGVSMISGNYNGLDTTLVAQYFGSSSAPEAPSTLKVGVEPDATVHAAQAPVSQAPVPIKTTVTTKPVTTPKPVAPKPTPKPITLPPTPAPTPKPIPETVPMPTATTTPTSTPVVASVALARPVFINPANKSVFEGATVKIVTLASNAESIVVYVDDREVGTRQRLSSDYFDLKVSLKAGVHIVTVKAIAGTQEVISAPLTITIQPKPIIVDVANSKIYTVQATGQQDQVVKAEVYLGKDAQKAEVGFSSYHIPLQRSTTGTSTDLWTGQLILFHQDQGSVFRPVTLPTVVVEDAGSNVTTVDIQWQNVVPTQPSLTRQYLFIKSYPSQYIDLLFNISGWYYKVILSIATIALLLNVFVEIKKQHPHVIASTLGFMTLLIVLILV